ncbi:ABC transporter permease [Mesobacillus zeae]|uniref:ABC transporter permease n=1 Tax=Mesobacillus zeae TaxID=1917180 RepID=A0A398B790_9BACI|nr:ABC transporter permease subunit [Mesobacillus zeae]RID83586.1 hypothetical protein D1970_15555 [Mesobacillus zeae]
MYEIGKREFVSLFKSFKSIMIIAILLATSYYSAKFASFIVTELTDVEDIDIHYFGLLGLIVLFGQLFIMGLSHDSINRELHERTMRFLVTRTSRVSILLGKFFGILMFWFVCLLTSFLLISIFAHKLDLYIFSQTMSLLTFQIALTIFVSVLIPKPSFTMFLGIVVGILVPIMGFWLTLTENVWVSWIKYITPFYYLDQDGYTFLVTFLFSGLLLFAAGLIFNRRDC